MRNARKLVSDPFGNYVVQYVLDLNQPHLTLGVVQALIALPLPPAPAPALALALAFALVSLALVSLLLGADRGHRRALCPKVLLECDREVPQQRSAIAQQW